MENAVDALKMGFAVLVFTIALSLTIYMFSQIKTTADSVLHSSDITEFMEYEKVTANSEDRIVGLETIIPTLYKYRKENYTVIFRNADGSYMPLYETQTDTNNWSKGESEEKGYINKYFSGDKSTSICSFDVDEETKRHEPWTGDPDKTKKMLDCFIAGGKYIYTDSKRQKTIDFKDGLYHYADKKFKENLGEYIYNVENGETKTDESLYTGLLKNKKKRVIIYTLLQD